MNSPISYSIRILISDVCMNCLTWMSGELRDPRPFHHFKFGHINSYVKAQKVTAYSETKIHPFKVRKQVTGNQSLIMDNFNVKNETFVCEGQHRQTRIFILALYDSAEANGAKQSPMLKMAKKEKILLRF